MTFRRDWTARALALVALVVAVGGGTAFAARHYLITSTKQIKPSVLKSLRRAGPAGPQGPQGPAGAKGANGTNGTNGSNGANGAVAAYYAGTGATAVSLTDAASKTVLSKTLPAGSYVVNADVTADAQQMNSSAGVALSCYLQWAGGSEFKSWVSPWDSNDDSTANGTISWNLAANLSSASTVTISCTDYSGTNGAQDTNSATISASADITAVQASGVS